MPYVPATARHQAPSIITTSKKQTQKDTIEKSGPISWPENASWPDGIHCGVVRETGEEMALSLALLHQTLLNWADWKMAIRANIICTLCWHDSRTTNPCKIMEHSASKVMTRVHFIMFASTEHLHQARVKGLPTKKGGGGRRCFFSSSPNMKIFMTGKENIPP